MERSGKEKEKARDRDREKTSFLCCVFFFFLFFLLMLDQSRNGKFSIMKDVAIQPKCLPACVRIT